MAVIADAAYIASASAAMPHIAATMASATSGSRRSQVDAATRRPPPGFEEAVERVAAKLPQGHTSLETIRGDAEAYRQQPLSLALAEIENQAALSAADSIAAATIRLMPIP